jgi:hypothetical protein
MPGGDELDQPRQAEEVDLELSTCDVDRDVLDRAVRAVAGVVDEHVEATVLREDAFDAGRHRVLVGDVHRERRDAGLLDPLHPVDPAGHGVRREAGLEQADRRPLPDPARAPGHQCHAVRHGPMMSAP